MDDMKHFYHDILGFEIMRDLDYFVEFENEGVRFGLCMREVMYDYSKALREPGYGQKFELTFSCESPEDVDETYENLIKKGVKGIMTPRDISDKRMALFSDPDGNIHRLSADTMGY